MDFKELLDQVRTILLPEELTFCKAPELHTLKNDGGSKPITNNFHRFEENNALVFNGGSGHTNNLSGSQQNLLPCLCHVPATLIKVAKKRLDQ